MINKKNGFTLVELLAVIVILAIILVIAVPQIMSTIEESRNGAFSSSAKLIASSAETLKLTNDTLGIEKTIVCEDVAEYNSEDYESCSITFDEGKAQVTLAGKGKFAGKYVCAGTRTNAVVSTECKEVCKKNEELVETIYYEIKNEDSCNSYMQTVVTNAGLYEYYGSLIQPYCNGNLVEEMDTTEATNYLVKTGLVTLYGLYENEVIEVKKKEVCKFSVNASEYISSLSNASGENGVIDANGIRYVGSEPNNYVYFNCDENDANGIPYGNDIYNYEGSCEIWRIIGVFDVAKTKNGTTKKRVKLVREESLLEASWDSSDDMENSGLGINDWSVSDLNEMLNTYYIGVSDTCLYCDTYHEGTCDHSCNNSIKPLSIGALSMIDVAEWYTGAIDSRNITLLDMYTAERGTQSGRICSPDKTNSNGLYLCSDTLVRSTDWIGEVGLIYPSDYRYASTDENCSTNIVGNNFSCKNNNWLHPRQSYESYWTISPYADPDYASFVWLVDYGGTLVSSAIDLENNFTAYGVRPSVYLTSMVKIVGGNGTSDSPYILD